jgi:cytochrome b561
MRENSISSHDIVVMESCCPEPRDDGALRFSYVAIFFHWAVAALILANILIAWQFHSVHGVLGSAILQIHKSVGITILLLGVLRLMWRLLNPPPPFAITMQAWKKGAAKIAERGFYFIMFAMPLTGWAIVSASGLPTPIMLFGVVRWPYIPSLGTLPFDQILRMYGLSAGAHHLLARTTYALLALHVLAALRHQFLKRDAVLGRMIPLLARRRTVVGLRSS